VIQETITDLAYLLKL